MPGKWAAEALLFATTVNMTGPDMTDAEMEFWVTRFIDAYHHDTYGSAA